MACEGDKDSFLFQLYEIFTCLGELGAIAQVHAENGDIIAQVTAYSSRSVLLAWALSIPFVSSFLHHCLSSQYVAGTIRSVLLKTCLRGPHGLGGGKTGNVDKQGRKWKLLEHREKSICSGESEKTSGKGVFKSVHLLGEILF